MSDNALAFFPWWDIGNPLEIDSLRLLPYEYGKRPGDIGSIAQKDIDGVLGSYRNLPRNRIRKATLLEVNGWRSGLEPDAFLDSMFDAREVVAFSALSERQLFVSSYSYSASTRFPWWFSDMTRLRRSGSRIRRAGEMVEQRICGHRGSLDSVDRFMSRSMIALFLTWVS